MTPFLKQVADIFSTHEPDRLLEYCFVFPNKRSSVFFDRYLRESLERQGAGTVIMPEIVTIDRLMASIGPDRTEATRYEQLFTLYTEYKRLSPGTATEFDRFRFWGDMLLSDFSDIDRFLVDAHALLVNIQRLRAINSTFLTPEQRDLIKQYWGEEKPEYPIDRFWTHIDAGAECDDDRCDEKFVKLWEILDRLYDAFNRSLDSQGLIAPGMIYRKAVMAIKEHGIDILPAAQYIFVGFNALSKSEHTLLLRLKAAGKADFYWDINFPGADAKGNKAASKVKQLASEFPSRYDLDEEPIERFADIEIIGVPSKSGQAKYAGRILDEWIRSGAITNTDNAIDTAIVMPDESLLIPMIHAVPEDINRVNVTMGFPMKQTPVASLLRRIISLHLRARKLKDEYTYYYADVQSIASHPLLHSVDRDECKNLNDKIRNLHLYNLPWPMIRDTAPSLAPIFKPVADPHDFNEVFGYVSGVIDFLRSSLDDGNSQRPLSILDAYTEALMQLREAAHRFHVTMEENTVFQLLESSISTATVNLNGEPLAGLQMMGVLETRALDFRNIIMLSMNERIFPRRHFSGSFIPEALRRGYGMMTADLRDAIYSYYFFRLLSRTNRAVLLYDSRTIGGKSSEKSRYLGQLLYMFSSGSNVRHTQTAYRPTTFNRTDPISIPKTPRIMQLLDRYRTPGSGKKLSPSAIKAYINCPLQFYFTRIEDINRQDEVTDYMDASTYGTIVHQVLERLYTSCRRNPADTAEEVPVDDALIDRLLRSRTLIDRLIVAGVNEHYNKLGPDCLDSLEGDSFAIGKLIRWFVEQMLNQEKRFTPFTFVGAEVHHDIPLDVAPGITINYTQVIDRIDRRGDALRIIDYKTGDDTIRLPSVSSMFTMGSSWPKAVLQLFLYANAYAAHEGYDGPIQPMVYGFRKIATDGLQPLLGPDKEPIADYRPFNSEFLSHLSRLMEEIFDPEVPFRPSEFTESCTFCQFKDLCGR